MIDGHMPYPKEQDCRVGCKVSWYIYDKKKDAEAASKAAKNNAILYARMGYDFGFQSPGSIDKLKDGRYEVCIP